MKNDFLGEISEVIERKNYDGVILKLIAMNRSGNWENYFVSFTLSNRTFLEMGDLEWLHLSGANIWIPDNFEEIKKIKEFSAEIDNVFFGRKHMSVDEFKHIIGKIINEKRIEIYGRSIKVDVEFHENEIYKIGTHSKSIFKNANGNLHRMADIIVGWPTHQEIFTPKLIESVEINHVRMRMPIEFLIGFYEYHIPNELCSTVCIYLPNYAAWIAKEKFAEGKRVEVAVSAENVEFLRELTLLFKISKSDEILIWDSCNFSSADLPKSDNEMLVVKQPIERDIDASSSLLIDKKFIVHDFSDETPYIKNIAITLDMQTGKRKLRQTFGVGGIDSKIDPLTKRKGLVASLKSEVVLFTSGNQVGAIEALKRILDKARVSIKILDPYFGNDDSDWDIFEEVATNIEIKILTSLEFRRKSPINFQSSLGALKSEIRKSAVMSIFSEIKIGGSKRNKCPFHDRYFIVDDKDVWSIGTSINGLGKRDSSIIKLDQNNCEEIIARFNYYWNSPSPQHKELISGTWMDFDIHRNIS